MTVHVRESTVIAAPARVVWDLLRDFNAHDRWHPAIASSHIEEGANGHSIGAVRNFRLQDGGMLREQLISCSDRDMSLRYCLLSAPVPLMNYVATMRLRPVTETDQCLLEWSSAFSPPDAGREAMISLVRDDIYRAGFNALKSWFSGAAQSARPVPRPKTNPPPQVVHSARPGTARLAKGIVMAQHGGPDVLVMQDIQTPVPGPGQVRLEQNFAGVNYIDVHCRTGAFDLVSLPGTPGMEAVGQVVELGPEVHNFQVGDRVGYACAPTGAYCTDRVMPGEMLVPLPDDLPDEMAAAILLKGMTASFLLHDVHTVTPGEVVLIHAASGGVGQLLVQWAHAIGARVVATASSADKLAVARTNGADYTINYRHEDFVSALHEITGGKGADVIYDGVGQSTIGRSFEAAAIRGHVVSFGEASGPLGAWDIGRLSGKSLRFSRPNFGHYVGSPVQMAHHASLLFNAIRNGYLRLPSPTVFPLEKAAEAHIALEERRLPWAAVLDTHVYRQS